MHPKIEQAGNCLGKRSKKLSMLHIMVLLKYLGSYANEASLQKIGPAMGNQRSCE